MAAEQERRQALPLVEDEDGLRRRHVGNGNQPEQDGEQNAEQPGYNGEQSGAYPENSNGDHPEAAPSGDTAVA